MKQIFCVAASVVLLSVFSCTKETNQSQSFKINRDITIHNCSNFTANNTTYSICFDTVTNESRCPKDAICVWEGYATAKFTLTSGTTNRNFSLSTMVINNTMALQNDTTINGITIALANLAPNPREIGSGKPPYVATLKISQ